MKRKTFKNIIIYAELIFYESYFINSLNRHIIVHILIKYPNNHIKIPKKYLFVQRIFFTTLCLKNLNM